MAIYRQEFGLARLHTEATAATFERAADGVVMSVPESIFDAYLEGMVPMGLARRLREQIPVRAEMTL